MRCGLQPNIHRFHVVSASVLYVTNTPALGLFLLLNITVPHGNEIFDQTLWVLDRHYCNKGLLSDPLGQAKPDLFGLISLELPLGIQGNLHQE